MMSKEEYIKAGGLVCPFCGFESLEGGFVEVDAGEGVSDGQVRELPEQMGRRL